MSIVYCPKCWGIKALIGNPAEAGTVLRWCKCPNPNPYDIVGHGVQIGHVAYEAELARLRADLTEARADVARFEAALDAANRELAQARAERDEYRHLYTVSELDRIKAAEKAERMQDNAVFFAQRYDEYSLVAKDTIDRSRATIAALVVACRAMWGDLTASNSVHFPNSETAYFIRRRVKDQQAKQAGE